MCSPGWGLNCFALLSGFAQLIFHEFYVAHDGPANGYRQRYGLLQSEPLQQWQGMPFSSRHLARPKMPPWIDSLEDGLP